MRIHTGRIDGLLVALIGTGGESSKAVSLGIALVVGLLAGESGLLKNCDLPHCHGLGAIGNDHDVRTVLGVQDEGLVGLGGEHALKSGDAVGLGETADVTKLATVGRTLVNRIDGCQSCEIAALGHDLAEAVGHLVGVGTLKQDVLYIYGLGKIGAAHNLDCTEHVAALVQRRNALLSAECEICNVGREVAGKLVLGVPALGICALGVAEKECLHVVGGGKLCHTGVDIFTGGIDVGL